MKITYHAYLNIYIASDETVEALFKELNSINIDHPVIHVPLGNYHAWKWASDNENIDSETVRKSAFHAGIEYEVR